MFLLQWYRFKASVGGGGRCQKVSRPSDRDQAPDHKKRGLFETDYVSGQN